MVVVLFIEPTKPMPSLGFGVAAQTVPFCPAFEVTREYAKVVQDGPLRGLDCGSDESDRNSHRRRHGCVHESRFSSSFRSFRIYKRPGPSSRNIAGCLDQSLTFWEFVFSYFACVSSNQRESVFLSFPGHPFSSCTNPALSSLFHFLACGSRKESTRESIQKCPDYFGGRS